MILGLINMFAVPSAVLFAVVAPKMLDAPTNSQLLPGKSMAQHGVPDDGGTYIADVPWRIPTIIPTASPSNPLSAREQLA